MIEFDARIDTHEVEHALERLSRAGNDLRPIFNAARRRFRADQKDHADRQQAPEGRWQSWSPRYVQSLQARPGRRKFRAHRAGPVRVRGKILGRLPKAFKIVVGRDFLRATSRVPWSGAHQRGDVVGRGVHLPRREFLWVSEKLLHEVVTIAVARFGAAWRNIGL